MNTVKNSQTQISIIWQFVNSPLILPSDIVSIITLTLSLL